MKLSLLFAAVCLFSSLTAAQTTTSFHSTGESAGALAHAGNTGLQIEVFTGDTSIFLLTFSSTQNSDGSLTMTDGFGSIPSQDFFHSNLERMSLNVDTSQVPGFRSTTCTFSFTPFFTETCGQGPLGLIQVNWTNNKITTSSLLEELHVTIPGPLTVDSHIDSDSSSANASGSYLGLSFPVADSASVDINRNTTITITQ